MKYYNMADTIASAMDKTLKDPEFTNIFSPSATLEKLAFTRVADENIPTEIEVEFAKEMEPSLEVVEKSASNPRGDCLVCGKSRANWSESEGVCKCASQGCSPLGGCKENCACGCKAKKAEVIMSDMLIKSAFDSLMKASSDLEEAGFETLATETLSLMNELIVEAKSKKLSKEEKAAAKEKERAAKEKQKMKAEKERAKLKAEKDKNDAKDKKMKEKLRAEKEMAREKAMKDKEKAKKSGK